MPDANEPLDALCRRALIERRLDAFDNVDTDRFLAGQIDSSCVLWIGRHLMRKTEASPRGWIAHMGRSWSSRISIP